MSQVASGRTELYELDRIEAYLSQNLYSWLRMDSITRVDWGSGDIRVSEFIDRVNVGAGARAIDSNHKFTQATQANQVAQPTTSVGFGGKSIVTFTAAQRYGSSLSAADWSTFNSNGMAMYAVFSRAVDTQMYLCNQNGSGVRNGILLNTGNIGGILTYIGNGGGVTSSPANLVLNNIPVAVGCERALDTTTRVYKPLNSIVATSTVGAGSGNETMAIGAQSLNFPNNPFNGKLADVMFATGAVGTSSTLRLNIRRYVQLRYGIS